MLDHTNTAEESHTKQIDEKGWLTNKSGRDMAGRRKKAGVKITIIVSEETNELLVMQAETLKVQKGDVVDRWANPSSEQHLMTSVPAPQEPIKERLRWWQTR